MRLGLEMSPIIIACGLAILAMMVTEASADDATDDTVSGWLITNDTTLRDTELVVNGSINIASVDVNLYNVTLTVRKGEEPYTEVVTEQGGRLIAHDCEVVFELDFIWLEFHGDAELLRTNLTGLGHMVFMEGQGLVDQCTLTNLDAVSWGADLFIRNSTFLGKASAGGGMDDMGNVFGIDLRIEDCTFSGPTCYECGITFTGTGLGGDPSRMVARNCTVENRYWGLDISMARDNSTAVVENVTIRNCTRGVVLRDCGNNILVRGLSVQAEEGFNITDCSGMHLSDFEVNGTQFGLRIFGADGSIHLSDVDIVGWPLGLEIKGMTVHMVNSTIHSPFQTMSVWGVLELLDCTHGRSCEVVMTGSHIRSNVTMSLSRAKWKDGPAVDVDTISFVDETGFPAGSMDPVLGASTQVVRYYANSTGAQTSGNVQGVIDVNGWAFRTPYFIPVTGGALDLTFEDDWTPRISIETPVPGVFLSDSSVGMEGTIDERGAGLLSARARHDGGDWEDFDFSADGTFQFTMDLPDGNRSIEIEATDVGGNVGEGIVKAVLVDTLPPFIEVLSPRPRTNQSSFSLIARTETGSSAFVDLKEVEVGPDGLFSVQMEKAEGIHSVMLRVVDRAGNENSTTYSIEVDRTPPLVSVYSPSPYEWISSRSFQVSGVTEESAAVLVNDIEAQRNGSEFTVTIDAVEGPVEIWVVVIDVAGNTVRIDLLVNLDTTSPELLVSEPEEGAITSDPVLIVSGAVYEDGPLNLSIEGVVCIPDNGLWSRPVKLHEGPNEIWVRAEDAAGHLVIVSRNVTLDSVPPSFTLALLVGDETHDPLPEELTISRGNVNLTVLVDEACELLVQDVGTYDIAAGTINIPLFLTEDDANEIVVNAVDRAGNMAGARTFTIMVDRTPPEISIIEPLERRFTGSSEVEVRGTTEPGAYLTVDGRIVTVDPTGAFNLTVSLVEGQNSFRLLSEDGLGNTGDLTLVLEYAPVEEPDGDDGDDASSFVVAAVAAVLVVAAVAVAIRYRRG